MSEPDLPARPTPPPLELSGATSPEAAVAAPPAPRAPMRREPARASAPVPRWKWAVVFGVVVVIFVPMAIYVNDHNSDASNGLPISRKALVQDNQMANVLAAQDQAPAVFTVVAADAGLGSGAVIDRALRIQMNRVIDQHDASPPIQAINCVTTASSAVARAFHCKVLSGEQYFNFDGVIQTASREVTLCRQDTPIYGQAPVPVSARCMSPTAA